MSKTYLRYEPAETFGVVASPHANVLFDNKTKSKVISAGVQEVLAWNIKTGELDFKLSVPYNAHSANNDTSEIWSLAIDDEDKYIAAGFASGNIRVWDFETKELYATFAGHRKAVVSLKFNKEGSRLASGSRDTDIIVWDIVAQTGMFRLRGHKDEVTDLCFVEKLNTPGEGEKTERTKSDTAHVLFSSSKDSLVKFWDLETQHCIHTIVGHRSSVWSVALHPRSNRIVTGTSDHLLRGITFVDEDEQEKDKATENTEGESFRKTTKMIRRVGAQWKLMSGPVSRQSNDRVCTLQYSKDGQFLACQTAGKLVEIYKVRSAAQVKKKIKRRLKRLREKQKQNNGESKSTEKDTDESKEPDDLESPSDVQLQDELELICGIRSDSDVRSFCFGSYSKADNTLEMLLSLRTNAIEKYQLSFDEDSDDDNGGNAEKKRKREQAPEITKTQALELQGHRSDVRSVALNSDNTLLLTAASGAVKLWNVKTKQCIRTMPSGYSLCCAFVPGEMHAIVGTKGGRLILYKLSTGEILSDIQAHDGALWSLDIRPDGRGFVTGGADKLAKFWDFELVEMEKKEKKSEDNNSGPKKAKENDEKQRLELGIFHTRTLKMSEDIMCVRYSKHKGTKKLMLAVSLLDCTVKVFHDDSLKFALSLYGHKLPVLSMDVSDDNTLLVTASADKNIKVWGLDFGDCHKSFFAHDASVMSIRFVPGTHYFFSGGKDSRVRYWDADKFEMILTLEAHVGEVWALAVSSDGTFLVSSGHDKSLRIWERTEDIVFLEEEREKEMEKIFDAKLDSQNDPSKNGSNSVPAVQAQLKSLQPQMTGQVESAAASKRTGEAVQAGERLMDAIDLADEEMQKFKKYETELKLAEEKLLPSEKKEREDLIAQGKGDTLTPLVAKPQPNLILLGRTPVQHVVHTLLGIKPNELDEALMVQPFGYASRLFEFLLLIVKDPNERHVSAEVAIKCSIILLRIHFKQIVANQNLNKTLLELRRTTRERLYNYQDLIGKNMAALNYIKDQVVSSTVKNI